MRVFRPRRSVLTVPGSNPRFLAKAVTTAADAVLLDLEDSVAPGQQAAAREQIIQALRDQDWGERLRTVRVNATSTPWFYRDLITVVEGAGAFIDAIVLPKVDRPEDIYMLDTLLTQIETAHTLPHRIAIEAQIETAQGMAQVEMIARSSQRLETLVFGPGDFAAAMGMPVLGIGDEGAAYPGHIWHAHLTRMLVAARAAGLQALDGPYGTLADLAGLQRSAQLSRMLGYDGKWAVHPAQVETINAVFTPSPAEIEQAAALLDTYRRSVAGGEGAVRSGGEMLDRASVAMAEQLLARAARRGRTGDGGTGERGTGERGTRGRGDKGTGRTKSVPNP